MKKSKLFLSSIALALVFVSCQPESETKTTLVDFENVTLNADSVWDGSDLSGTSVNEEIWGTPVTNYYGSFSSQNVVFKNVYTAEWYSWKGFACSAKTDTNTAGFINQYSVVAGSGAMGSTKFAVAYDSSTISSPSNENGNYKIRSLMLTNSTYAYFAMLNGTSMSRKFSNNDWFKVIIKGYLNNIVVAQSEYYLADFRDGKNILSKTWNKIDLSSFGEVDRLTFTFDSSDKSYGYINNPTYVCIDNIEFTQIISAK